MTTFVFTVSFFLRHYGSASVEVIAPNAPAALLSAMNDTDKGWMLHDAYCEVGTVKRGWAATCSHDSHDFDRGLRVWTCTDCQETHSEDGDSLGPSATRKGFEAYCARIATARQYEDALMVPTYW